MKLTRSSSYSSNNSSTSSICGDKNIPLTPQKSKSPSYGSTPTSIAVPIPSDPFENSSRQPKAADIDLCSLYVLYTLTVVAEAARGLLLPSIWPYYSALGGSKAGLGALVGIYSLGRMLSVIPLGHISDQVPAGSVLVVASFIQSAGHFLYAMAPGTKALFIARALVGFGSATTSVARAHVTKTVPHHERTHHLAYLSGLQFVGFAVLPVLGGLISLFPAGKLFNLIDLNGFTYPAWILVVANAACAYMVFKLYKSPPCKSRPAQSFEEISSAVSSQSISPSSSLDSISSDRSAASQVTTASRERDVLFMQQEQQQPDYVALTICLLINLVFRGVLAQLETVSIPFMTEQFGMDYGTASVWMTIIGGLGLFIYFSFKPVSRLYSDKTLVAVGLCFIAFGCLPLSVHTFVQRMSVSFYIMLLSFTWSIAYPIGQTAILALFSKVLRGCSVGSFMGLFSASGAISPLVLSVLATKLWEHYGRESVFGFTVGMVSVAGVLMLCTHRRLAPPGMVF